MVKMKIMKISNTLQLVSVGMIMVMMIMMIMKTMILIMMMMIMMMMIIMMIIMIGDNLAVGRGGNQLAVLFGDVATYLPGLFRIETNPITRQILSNLGLVTQDFFGTLVHSVS